MEDSKAMERVETFLNEISLALKFDMAEGMLGETALEMVSSGIVTASYTPGSVEDDVSALAILIDEEGAERIAANIASALILQTISNAWAYAGNQGSQELEEAIEERQDAAVAEIAKDPVVGHKAREFFDALPLTVHAGIATGGITVSFDGECLNFEPHPELMDTVQLNCILSAAGIEAGDITELIYRRPETLEGL